MIIYKYVQIYHQLWYRTKYTNAILTSQLSNVDLKTFFEQLIVNFTKKKKKKKINEPNKKKTKINSNPFRSRSVPSFPRNRLRITLDRFMRGSSAGESSKGISSPMRERVIGAVNDTRLRDRSQSIRKQRVLHSGREEAVNSWRTMELGLAVSRILGVSTEG